MNQWDNFLAFAMLARPPLGIITRALYHLNSEHGDAAFEARLVLADAGVRVLVERRA